MLPIDQKKILAVFFIAVTIFVCPDYYGQKSQLDSLRGHIGKMPDDTTKLNTYMRILSVSMSDEYLKYCYPALTLADQLLAKTGNTTARNALFRKKIYLYHHLSYYYYATYFNTDSVKYGTLKRIEIENKAADLAEKTTDSDLINEQVKTISDLYMEINLFTKAMDIYVNRLKVAEQKQDVKSVLFCLRGISDTYARIRNHKKALEFELRTLDVLKKAKEDSASSFYSFVRIGDKYRETSDYKNSLHYYSQAFALLQSGKLFEAKKNDRKKHLLLGKMAGSYTGMKNYAGARQYLFNALEIPIVAEYFDESGTSYTTPDSTAIGQVYMEIGQTYFAEKNYEQALAYQLKCIALIERGSFWEDPTLTYLATGQLYLKLKQYDAANKYILKAKASAEKKMDLYNQKEIALAMSEVYKAKGDLPASNASLITFYRMKDSIDRAANAEELLYKELNYEHEKKEEYLRFEQKKQESIHAEEKKKNQLILFSVCGFLLLLAISTLNIFNNLKKTRRANQVISEQKHLVEEKQKEITDSINYAQRLQEAILPAQEFINAHLADSFVLYKPKDIVAGDFYWAESLGNLFFIAAADSTGHGVPGAMVSVVCSNALNRAVNEFHLRDTGKILDKTRELVVETFSKSNDSVKDGMDISLLCINRQNREVTWSGANNPLWYVQEGRLEEIKADKQPIGRTDNPAPFSSHAISCQENTTFYLFTDGLADQFGGPKGKKFKYKQFEELVISINDKPMPEQSQIIQQKFEAWKGALEQVDDVCVIGIKI